jgi:DNA-binding beta-propeller fold protein YncE
MVWNDESNKLFCIDFSGNMLIIDIKSKSLIQTISIGDYGLKDIVIDTLKNKAYVCGFSNSISIIDLNTLKV